MTTSGCVWCVSLQRTVPLRNSRIWWSGYQPLPRMTWPAIELKRGIANASASAPCAAIRRRISSPASSASDSSESSTSTQSPEASSAKRLRMPSTRGATSVSITRVA